VGKRKKEKVRKKKTDGEFLEILAAEQMLKKKKTCEKKLKREPEGNKKRLPRKGEKVLGQKQILLKERCQGGKFIKTCKKERVKQEKVTIGRGKKARSVQQTQKKKNAAKGRTPLE